MPREQDVAALLKRLLAKEVTDADDNEVLDEIVALRDNVTPADAVTVDDTTDYRAIVDVGLAGYVEACEESAAVDTQADWEAGAIPPEADTTSSPGGVKLAKFQEMPPFAEWTTAGSWYVNAEGELVAPDPYGSASSPLIPTYGRNNWAFSAEFRASVTSPVHATANPDGTYCVKYLTAKYYDASLAPVANSAGWTSNGHATKWGKPGYWSTRANAVVDGVTCSGYWSYVSGPTVAFLTITINGGTAYPPPSFKVRRPMLVVYESPPPGYLEPYQYHLSQAVIMTKELDLGDTPTRPVLFYPIHDAPAGTSAIVTQYRTRAMPADAWGPWFPTIQLSSGGALTAANPQRYLQLEIQLATSDTTQTPVLSKAGVYD